MKRRYFEQNGKTYIECKDYRNVRVFEIVDKFPQGYIFWNVPFDYPDFGYIALAKPSDIPYNIKTDDLKCIYVGEDMQKKIHNYAHMCNNDISFLNYNDIIKELKK